MPDEVPASPEEAGEMVVRVSGTEGTAYAGTYASIAEEGEPRTIEDALGDEPTEYEVEIEQSVSDGVSAFFEKTEPGNGELEAEILVDGEVIAESTTYADVRFGHRRLVPASRTDRGDFTRGGPARRELLNGVRAGQRCSRSLRSTGPGPFPGLRLDGAIEDGRRTWKGVGVLKIISL